MTHQISHRPQRIAVEKISRFASLYFRSDYPRRVSGKTTCVLANDMELQDLPLFEGHISNSFLTSPRRRVVSFNSPPVPPRVIESFVAQQGQEIHFIGSSFEVSAELDKARVSFYVQGTLMNSTREPASEVTAGEYWAARLDNHAGSEFAARVTNVHAGNEHAVRMELVKPSEALVEKIESQLNSRSPCALSLVEFIERRS